MPDKTCPVCGAKTSIKMDLIFRSKPSLDLKGNKEPDIDLNFSGDYQSKAHRYTEVIFGKGQTSAPVQSVRLPRRRHLVT